MADARELHIVQPRLVVAMGEPTVTFLAELDFPLSESLDADRWRAPAAHPTIEALVTRTSTTRWTSRERRRASGLRSRRSARGGPSSRRTRNGRAAGLGLLAALCAWDALANEPRRRRPLDVAIVALVLIPATFGVVWLLLPVADARGLFDRR